VRSPKRTGPRGGGKWRQRRRLRWGLHGAHRGRTENTRSCLRQGEQLCRGLGPRRVASRHRRVRGPMRNASASGSQTARLRHTVSGSGSGRSPAEGWGRRPLEPEREDGVSVGRFGGASRRRALRTDSPPLPALLRLPGPSRGSPRERAKWASFPAGSRHGQRSALSCLRSRRDASAAKTIAQWSESHRHCRAEHVPTSDRAPTGQSRGASRSSSSRISSPQSSTCH
jgi:hypothetical protein